MAKRGHAFQITIAALRQPGGSAGTALTFVHANHDDILSLIEEVRRDGVLDPDAAAPVVLGLKLLGQVMLERKDDPLFDPLRGAMRDVIRNLKSSRARTPAALQEWPRDRESDHSG